MRNADQPISHPKHDSLGRAGFALALAELIDQLVIAKDGFIIGLQGEWGSGKTSLIRLTCRYLRHLEMARISGAPLRDEPNPRPVTLEDLERMADVYDRIDPILTAVPYSDKDISMWGRTSRRNEFKKWLESETDIEMADRYWQLKIRADAAPQTIIVPFSPWLIAGRAELASALLSELARGLNKYFGPEVRQAFGGVLARLAEFAPVVGAGVDIATAGFGGTLVRASGIWAQTTARRLTTGPTLEEMRGKLKGVLKNFQGQKVLGSGLTT
jgi:hypothetical protein